MGVFENIYTGKIQAKYNEVFTATQASDTLMYRLFYNAITNSFTWKGMPDNIPNFLPEENLYWWGQMAGFMDGDEFKMFPCYMGGEYLENGLYSDYVIIAKNGKSWIKKREDIELCFNNRDRLPSTYAVFDFSDRASFALRAVDVELERVILPKIIEGADDSQLSAIADMYDKDKELMPFRTTKCEGFSNGDIKVHSLFDNREADVLALWDVFTRYRNLFYTTFGFQNTEIQKKERLTEQEAAGNVEMIRYTLMEDMYRQRVDFCERINSRFGQNISIELNRDTSTVWALSATNEDKRRVYEAGNISTTLSEESELKVEKEEVTADDTD